MNRADPEEKDLHDFARGSIPHAILSIAVPMMAAQIVNILYNVVDRIYIGHIAGTGQLALTGLGLCMPLISIVAAFQDFCGMGGSALFAIERGSRNDREAEGILGNCFTLVLIFGTALMAAGELFKQPILYLFGASDETYPYAAAYLTIYLLGTWFVMMAVVMNAFINAQGFGKIGMLTVVLGAVINIVLDPILIYGLHMGVQGAAVATVLAQFCSTVWTLRFLTGKRALLKLRREHMKLQPRRVRKILSLGVSGLVMGLTGGLVQAVCNATAFLFGGDLYVAVLAVANSIREVAVMGLSGMTSGCRAVIGYNYGAGQYSRVRQGMAFTLRISLTYGVLCSAVSLLIPDLIIRMYNQEPELLAAGVPALRVYMSLFFLMALQFTGQTGFVALNRPRQAIFFSCLRKAFLVTPLVLLLPRLGFGVLGVFMAEPISDVLGGVTCFLVMTLTLWKPLKKLDDLPRSV